MVFYRRRCITSGGVAIGGVVPHRYSPPGDPCLYSPGGCYQCSGPHIWAPPASPVSGTYSNGPLEYPDAPIQDGPPWSGVWAPYAPFDYAESVGTLKRLTMYGWDETDNLNGGLEEILPNGYRVLLPPGSAGSAPPLAISEYGVFDSCCCSSSVRFFPQRTEDAGSVELNNFTKTLVFCDRLVPPSTPSVPTFSGSPFLRVSLLGFSSVPQPTSAGEELEGYLVLDYVSGVSCSSTSDPFPVMVSSLDDLTGTVYVFKTVEATIAMTCEGGLVTASYTSTVGNKTLELCINEVPLCCCDGGCVLKIGMTAVAPGVATTPATLLDVSVSSIS